MAWIDDWRPDFIYPEDGETEQGMVFRTGSGPEETLWSCIEWQPETYFVRYARVTPASRFAHIAVQCRAVTPESARVEVHYTMTALNAAGEAILAKTTAEAFSAGIEDWKMLIQMRIVSRRV